MQNIESNHILDSKNPNNLQDSILDSIQSKNIFVNLSMWGSTLNERNIVFSYLFKQKVIKNVITTLDWWVFHYENDVSKFDFLYTNNFGEIFKMYFNEKTIKCAFLWEKSEPCVGKKFDIFNESIVSWMGDDSMKYFGGLQNFLKNKGNVAARNLREKPLEMGNITKSNKFSQELATPFIKILESNPQTQFHIILPTYPRLFWALQGEIFFTTWQENIRFFLRHTRHLRNVRIYGLDDLNFADDIANFKDIQHYSPQMNVLQLRAIATQSHILNTQNIESYFAKMQEKIKNYDVTAFLNAVENMP
ncbi:hypothetical protein [Helicobacter saguini]|uniref:Uncharacterized protein n=1 Tax=Helicobacter saguini TaxID=1548018 RepID=A0A6L7D6E3_9HELI|nr:hypothetical protein [Helicobacter saguini]MWV69632.1 hypothetical protein [Helicobacter saguini]